MNRIMIGADPEYFLYDTQQRKFLGAHHYFGRQHKNSRFFRDGYALELNFPPSTSLERVWANHQASLIAAKARLPNRVVLVSTPAIQIDLPNLVASHPPEDLLMWGCHPTFNAYINGGLEPQHPEINAIDHPWRYCGGHLHFSTPFSNNGSVLLDIQQYPMLVKLLDWKLGIPHQKFYNNPLQFERRRLYGKAGEFRVNEYSGYGLGIEYRVMGSEMWATKEIALQHIRAGLQVIENFEALKNSWSLGLERKVVTALNSGSGLATFPGF